MSPLSKVFLMLVVLLTPSSTIRTGGKTLTEQGERQSLKLSIVSTQTRYKPSDQFKMNVLLTNSSYRDIYVLGSLQWGRSASLLFHIRDSAGKEIKPRAFPDDQTQVSPNDKSAFVKLLPNHFLGTEFFAPMEDLNLDRPGKYTIFVEYKCPFSDSDVDLQPFWGADWGVLKSNNLIIEVVH